MKWLPALLLLLGCARGPTLAQGQYQGVVELHERNLSFESAGKIRTLSVQRGAHVAADQPLVSLDDTLERRQVEIREAEAKAADAQLDLLRAGAKSQDLRSAQAKVQASRATEETLRQTAERDRTLRAANALPQSALDDAEGRLRQATADRQGAEARLASLVAGARTQEVQVALARSAQAQAALLAEQERLARFVLHAPVAGEILETMVEPGEVVQAGSPVVTLGEPLRPYVDVFVPEAELSGLQAGTAAKVRLDGEPQSFEGAIESVGRTLEFTPRYLFSPKERPNLVMRVRVNVTDPKGRLHAGLPAFVDFDRVGAR